MTSLKQLQEELKSFISSKSQVAKQLKDQVMKIKEKNCSSIGELDDLVGEINSKSQKTFENFSLQVKSHTSTLEDCFNGILVEADELLAALHGALSKQEEALNSFVDKQHQRTLSTIEATRSVSKVNEDLFDTLDTQTCKFCAILEDSQAVNNEQFFQFQKKFEDCAAKEEKYLLEKVAELMADSNSRKKNMVEEAIGNLRETGIKRALVLKTEMEKTRNTTSSIREKWGAYVKAAESSYNSNTSALRDGKCCLEEGIQNGMEKVKLSSETWKNAQSSLSTISQNHIGSSDTIIRDGAEANQLLRAKVLSLTNAAIEDCTLANKELALSIDDSLRRDRELHENSNAMIAPCHEKLRELQSMHHIKVTEVSDCAETSLKKDYLVDEPTCSTPRKKSIKVPSPKSIEELKSPAIDELIKRFWEDKVLAKHAGGELKNLSGAIESQNNRQPFTAIN